MGLANSLVEVIFLSYPQGYVTNTSVQNALHRWARDVEAAVLVFPSFLPHPNRRVAPTTSIVRKLVFSIAVDAQPSLPLPHPRPSASLRA